MTYDEVVDKLADELVELHTGGYIELDRWGTALELVSRYYNIQMVFEKKGKPEK